MKLSLELDDYKKAALDVLSGTGAFLRVSRSEGLLVTDAPRRPGAAEAVIKLEEMYLCVKRESLLYLTPKYGLNNPETESAFTVILKADRARRDKLIRMGLSRAMREKDEYQTAFYKILLERMNQG